MNFVSIIEKKKQGLELSTEEIQYFADAAARSSVPDYQLSALLMAIRLNGMSARETTDLTLAMANSGDIVNLDGIVDYPVDKHSTGGVGDTTSLILAPLVAACGVPVAKMSGRGLGHTGGTLDKLESIPGMSIELSEEQFQKNIQEIGLAIIGQTGNLAPADKLLYALRDVTSTVDSIPLIASSVMSKKIAGGAKAIVLDVKAGAGAILPTLEQSTELAKSMVEIGKLANRPVVAVLSGMDEPLGSHIGNALEVKEAIDVLAGRTKGALLDVSLILGGYMLLLAGKASSLEDAKKKLLAALDSGKGLEKLKLMIANQGGNPAVCDNLTLLPQASIVLDVLAPHDGYVGNMKTIQLGYTAQNLGAGRQRKEDAIDPAVGFVLHKRVGDSIQEGEVLATIYANAQEKADRANEEILQAIPIEKDVVEPTKLIFAIVDDRGVHTVA